jgi:hypothetical protein
MRTGFAEMRGWFDQTAAGMAQIVAGAQRGQRPAGLHRRQVLPQPVGGDERAAAQLVASQDQRGRIVDLPAVEHHDQALGAPPGRGHVIGSSSSR